MSQIIEMFTINGNVRDSGWEMWQAEKGFYLRPIDGMNNFSSETAVRLHVLDAARRGNHWCHRALEFLFFNQRNEYERIINRTETLVEDIANGITLNRTLHHLEVNHAGESKTFPLDEMDGAIIEFTNRLGIALAQHMEF